MSSLKTIRMLKVKLKKLTDLLDMVDDWVWHFPGQVWKCILANMFGNIGWMVNMFNWRLK